MAQENCVICMEPLRNPDEEVYETKCGHKFHKNCLMGYCNYSHGEEYAIYSSIKCPLCNTDLNCRFDKGDDIFPEKISNVNTTNIIKTNVEKALDIIPEDEYEMIVSPDDILIDINLTPSEKNEVYKEIEKRKYLNKGGKKRRIRKTKRSKQSKRKNGNKKNKTKRKRYHKRVPNVKN